MSIVGQAAGAASLPFFSSLFSQHRLGDFAAAVNRAISRIAAVSLLACAWMIASPHPPSTSLPRRLLQRRRRHRDRHLLRHLRHLARPLDRARHLRPGLLRRAQHPHARRRRHHHHPALDPHLPRPLPHHRHVGPGHRLRRRHPHPHPRPWRSFGTPQPGPYHRPRRRRNQPAPSSPHPSASPEPTPASATYPSTTATRET